MQKNRNPEEKKEKENIMFLVRFQSHLNMRECYLPCSTKCPTKQLYFKNLSKLYCQISWKKLKTFLTSHL